MSFALCVVGCGRFARTFVKAIRSFRRIGFYGPGRVVFRQPGQEEGKGTTARCSTVRITSGVTRMPPLTRGCRRCTCVPPTTSIWNTP